MRTVVVGSAPEDRGLANAVHTELAARSIDAWPAGPEIAARYASSELIARLESCDGLALLATPAAVTWPFALVQVRLARELSRGVLVLSVGLREDVVSSWLGTAEAITVLPCADALAAASAIEHWTLPPLDRSPSIVRFTAARSTILRVASHGGRLGEAAAAGIERGLLTTAALHLRSIGLVDFSGPLDDDRTTLITVG